MNAALFATLAGNLLVFAQSLVLTPIIISVAGSETFGGYVLVVSYLGIIFGISSCGVGMLARRNLPSAFFSQQRATLFYPQLWFQVAAVLILGIISAAAYAALEALGIIGFPSFSAWAIPIYLLAYTLYSQTTDYFRYTHRLGIFNLAVVAQPYLFVLLALVVYGVWDVLNVATLVLAMTISSVVVGGCLCIALIREIGVRFSLPEARGLRNEINLGYPLILVFLVDVFLASGDRYLIAVILSVHDVGVYVPAYALGSLVLVVPKVFCVVLPPLINYRMDANDTEGVKKLVDAAMRNFLILAIPYAVGGILLGREILSLYATDAVAEQAWLVLPMVSIASIFCGLTLIKSNILYAQMKTRSLLKINLISVSVNLILNVVLLLVFKNVLVSALATLISYWVGYLGLTCIIRRGEVDVAIDKSQLAFVWLNSLGMAIVVFGVQNFSQVGGGAATVINIMTGVVTYFLLHFSWRKNRADVAFFRGFAQNSK